MVMPDPRQPTKGGAGMLSSLRRSLFGTGADQREALCRFNPDRETGRDEQLERFGNAAYALYWQAERSRARGRSYRDFRVGCGVFAYRADLPLGEGRFRAFYGMNSKAEKDGRNICAEPVALDAANALGYTDAVGIVVIGQTQEDERGRTPRTLRPCAHCRAFMRHSPLVKPDTLVVTALPPPSSKAEWEDIPHEVFTFQDLCLEYGEPL